MKRLLILSLILGSCIQLASAQKQIKSEKPLYFSKTEFSGNLNVRLVHSDTARIEIELNDAQINQLNWTIKDSCLTVRLKPGSQNKGNGNVTVYYNNIDALKASEAKITGTDTLQAKMLDIELQSGATVTTAVDTKDLYLKVGGNSTSDVSGTSKYLTLIAGAKSKVDCRNLLATDVRVEAASAAEAYVYVSERLQISSGTGAAVFYKGAPEIIRSTSKMMGSINSIGE